MKLQKVATTSGKLENWLFLASGSVMNNLEHSEETSIC